MPQENRAATGSPVGHLVRDNAIRNFVSLATHARISPSEDSFDVRHLCCESRHEENATVAEFLIEGRVGLKEADFFQRHSFHNVVAALAHLCDLPLVVRCGDADDGTVAGLFAIVADTNANMLLLGDEAIGARYPFDDLVARTNRCEQEPHGKTQIKGHK